MDVRVYLTVISEERFATLDKVMDVLNEAERKRAHAFHQPLDKYRFLAGRWLLQTWLCDNSLTQTLAEITLDEYKRPLLAGISFSISHAGHWAGIAICTGNETIGFDIEEKKPLAVQDYMLPFTPGEQQHILHEDSHNRFYHLWARKEAALKAIGQGFLLEPTTVNALENVIAYKETALYLQELNIAPGYVVYIATGQQSSNVKLVVKD